MTDHDTTYPTSPGQGRQPEGAGMTQINGGNVVNWLNYQGARRESAPYKKIRFVYTEAALALLEYTPDCTNRQQALWQLKESMMIALGCCVS